MVGHAFHPGTLEAKATLVSIACSKLAGTI